MKKNLCYLSGLIIMCLFLFSACSSETPGGAAKKYTNYLKSGKYDKFIDGIAMGEDISAEEKKEAKAMFTSMMEKGKKGIEQKGGIKDVKIVSEEIDEDGETATVVLNVIYGDGTNNEQKYDMIKEKGDWKMEIKK